MAHCTIGITPGTKYYVSTFCPHNCELVKYKMAEIEESILVFTAIFQLLHHVEVVTMFQD
jgi:hypothetical protein